MEIKLNELNDIFSKAFNTQTNITADSVREDFETWDSINQLNLVVELEDFYHVRFTMDEIKNIISVKNIMEILKKK